jgi:hypothetical protein
LKINSYIRRLREMPGERRDKLMSVLPLYPKYRNLWFIYSLVGLKFFEDYFDRKYYKAGLFAEALSVYVDFEYLYHLMQKELDSGYNPGAIPKVNHLVLYSLIRALKPNVVVETGVAAGLSSYFILKALEKNNSGRLLSIDLPNYASKKGYINKAGEIDFAYTPPDKGVGWVVPNIMRRRWQMIFGDSLRVLEELEVEPELFYHDSDHSYEVMIGEYRWALARRTNYILSDDVNWNCAWSDFVKKHHLEHFEFVQDNSTSYGFLDTRPANP